MRLFATPILAGILFAAFSFAQDQAPPEPAPEEPAAEPAPEEPKENAPDEPKEKPEAKPEKKKEEPKKKEPKPQVVPLRDGKAKGPVDLDNEDLGFEQIQLLAKAMETIRTNYVDKDKVSYDRLMEGALDGMLKSLDPHCSYVRNESLLRENNNVPSSYNALGLTIAMEDGEIVIVSVREDGPAAEAGVMPSDRIVKIGEKFTSQIGVVDAAQLLAGRPGEKVTITVRRPKTRETIAVEMTRRVSKKATIRDGVVLAKTMTGPNRIGYVRILEFGRNTHTDLAEALDELDKGDGIEALVLDLRNNPGGLLSTSVAVVGEFVEPGKVVVTTRGRSPSRTPPPHRTPKRGDEPRQYPMAVLINHNSASGAELVSGALQDLHRAVVVGETSFGKGSVQSLIPIAGGKALRLTTAKYYTPSKKTIHENGVVPNIPATLDAAAEKRLFTWWREPNRSDDLAGEIARLDDNQLQRAVDSLKGVLVYRSMQSGDAPIKIEIVPASGDDGPEGEQK